jgi:predicted RNA-binding protein YlqC (UPF0109 family)
MLKVLLLIFAAQLAFGAACPKTGSSPGAVFLCADSGNADTNRANFQDTLNSATYDCGDTIVLPVANHDTAVTGTSGTAIISTPIGLPAKNTTLCNAGGKYLNIIGARDADLPPRGTRISTAYETMMPVIRSAGSYQAMTIASGAKHYRIRGLLFMPKTTVDAGCTAIPTTTCTLSSYLLMTADTITSYPDDVVVERIIDEKGVLLTLTVNPDDLGRVIGKRGGTAQSLRTLLRALVPEVTLPFGFRGVGLLKTNDSLNDTAGTTPKIVGVMGTGVASALSGAILPPIPFRVKVTKGDVSTAGTFVGQPGPLELASPQFYWGVKFEKNNDPLHQTLLLHMPLLDVEVSQEMPRAYSCLLFCMLR